MSAVRTLVIICIEAYASGEMVISGFVNAKISVYAYHSWDGGFIIFDSSR